MAQINFLHTVYFRLEEFVVAEDVDIDSDL